MEKGSKFPKTLQIKQLEDICSSRRAEEDREIQNDVAATNFVLVVVTLSVWTNLSVLED